MNGAVRDETLLQLTVPVMFVQVYILPFLYFTLFLAELGIHLATIKFLLHDLRWLCHRYP